MDQGYTGDQPAAEAKKYGIRLEVVKLPIAKRDFVLLPWRWVVECSFAWMAHFRRLARDYERFDLGTKPHAQFERVRRFIFAGVERLRGFSG